MRLGVVNVQTGAESALGNGSIVATLPAASLAGKLLVATLRTTGGTTPSVAPAGWVLAIAVNEPAAAFRSEIWYYANNPGGVTSVTFTLPAGAFGIGELTEWKNVSTVTPLDRTGSAAVTTATNSTTVSTSAPTTVANELAITDIGSSRNGTAYTLGAGWTNLFTDVPLGTASDYRANLGAAVASETVMSNAAETWSVLIATFK